MKGAMDTVPKGANLPLDVKFPRRNLAGYCNIIPTFCITIADKLWCMKS